MDWILMPNIVEMSIKLSRKFCTMLILRSLRMILLGPVRSRKPLDWRLTYFRFLIWRFFLPVCSLEFETAVNLFIKHSDEEEEKVLKSLSSKLSKEEDTKLADSFVQVSKFHPDF